MIGFIIPDEVATLYEASAPLYRIHSMGGIGMEVVRRWKSDVPAEFMVRWGMRPLGVAMDGWVSVTAGWTALRSPKNPRWRFDGFGSSFNYPGHTMQRGLFKWSRSAPFERLLHWVTEEAIEGFKRGCPGSAACSHRDPAVRDAEILTEGGFTISGAPPLFQRVW